MLCNIFTGLYPLIFLKLSAKSSFLTMEKIAPNLYVKLAETDVWKMVYAIFDCRTFRTFLLLMDIVFLGGGWSMDCSVE